MRDLDAAGASMRSIEQLKLGDAFTWIAGPSRHFRFVVVGKVGDAAIERREPEKLGPIVDFLGPDASTDLAGPLHLATSPPLKVDVGWPPDGDCTVKRVLLYLRRGDAPIEVFVPLVDTRVDRGLNGAALAWFADPWASTILISTTWSELNSLLSPGQIQESVRRTFRQILADRSRKQEVGLLRSGALKMRLSQRGVVFDRDTQPS